MSDCDVSQMEEIMARPQEHPSKHPKCLGYRDEWTLEYDCEYMSNLTCDECKYGLGKKDPEAKCNHN